MTSTARAMTLVFADKAGTLMLHGMDAGLIVLKNFSRKYYTACCYTACCYPPFLAVISLSHDFLAIGTRDNGFDLVDKSRNYYRRWKD